MNTLTFFQPFFFFIFVFGVLALFAIVGIFFDEHKPFTDKELLKLMLVLALVIAFSSTVAFMDEKKPDPCVCKYGKLEFHQFDAGE